MNVGDDIDVWLARYARADLAVLIPHILQGAEAIAELLRGGALNGVLGSANTANVQDETQQKLDIIANDILLEKLSACPAVAAIASEEMAERVDAHPQGKYLVAFDPLDGSSNIDVTASVGTIFSVLEANASSVSVPFLQPGQGQVAAGYVLYGPQTVLVLTTGEVVSEFVWYASQWRCTTARMQIPVETQEFAVNLANRSRWEAPVQRYVDECVAGVIGARGQHFRQRYIGSMVADVHRILSRGGVFLYPAEVVQGDVERESERKSKLRLLYEVNPMGWLVECAGGRVSDGVANPLTLLPSSLHQRVAVMLGSRAEIARLEAYHHE